MVNINKLFILQKPVFVCSNDNATSAAVSFCPANFSKVIRG